METDSIWASSGADRKNRKLAGIGQMVVSSDASDLLVVPNLGSCLGVAVFDPQKKVGGVVHCLLPLSSADPKQAQEKPTLYVDTGVATLLDTVIGMGATKRGLIIVAAGCGNINDANNVFEIGKKNHTIFRKVMWKNGLMIKAEHIGDSHSRTLSLDMSSGKMSLRFSQETIVLFG